MKKLLTSIFAMLMLMVMGVVNGNAQERISLQEVGFHTWDGWDGNAMITGDAECTWEIGISTGTVYGDPTVNSYADLTQYSRLYVTVTEGTPRVLFNRLKEEGQGGDTFEDSYLVDIPNKGWCTQKYQTIVDNVYIYDLKAIAKDYGFVHLHSIKGANWANVTVENLELETSAKAQQVGWTSIIRNGNLEGEEVNSFVVKELPSSDILSPTILDGVGMDGTRGIRVNSMAGASNEWDSQFWITLPESLPEGTRYRVSFDYRANQDVIVATQAHGTPGHYIHYEMIGNVNFTTEWQSFKYENEITAAQAANADGILFQSIAFNLSTDKENDVEFFFDNIRFEVYKYGVSAAYAYDVIQLDFGFDTNLPALVKACGKRRLMYPNDCVYVRVNGEDLEVLSVEGFADGCFYVFMNEIIEDDAAVEVSFTNPADATYHLSYDGGPGGDVKDFTGYATYDFEVASAQGAYAWLYVTPEVFSADPENGSFNLPNNISEFKVTFDKKVDCAALVAKLGNEALTVEPADGFAESIVLKRTSATDLATGEYALNISKIYPEYRIDDEFYGDTTISLHIGKVELDPADTVRQVMVDCFKDTYEGQIPEGWYMVYDGNVLSGSAASGARMRTFSEGGDFTRGFYTRTNSAELDMCFMEYGSVEGYELTLEAGKKYRISYNLTSWKTITNVRFDIFDPNGELVYTCVDECMGSLNGVANVVVTGSNFVEYIFVPEESGNYRVRWTPTNANGDLTSGMNEIIFANPMVTYIPNNAGAVEIQALKNALETAKVLYEVVKSESRYAGEALDALSAAILKYEAEAENYTNPSDYTKAVVALDAVAKAMRDHRELCDTYDALALLLEKVVADNANNKFASTELYAELKVLAAKYVLDGVKPITNSVELQVAIDELQVPVNSASKHFTQGASNVSTTGVAALVERIRLGASALFRLGVPENDELIVAADNAITDDDELAEEIKNRLKKEIYGYLRNPDNELFEEKMDEATLETYTDQYDMTVFMKNPNIYRLNGATSFSSEDVPGWYVPQGYNEPNITSGWSDTGYGISDCVLQTWATGYAIEQTIYDLPAGVYTIKAGFGERNDEMDTEGSFFYVKTSGTPYGEYASTVDCPFIGQQFPSLNIETQQVVVTDGMLTIGVVGGPSSHTFFNDIRILMCGAVEGFDYNAAYGNLTGELPTTTNNVLTVQDTEVFKGSSFIFPVSMSNENAITAFQCDVYLSEGLSLNWNDEGDYDVVLNAARKTSTHSVATSVQPDGAIRVVAYSSANKDFRGNVGELFTLNLMAHEGFAEHQQVEIRNIRLSTADQQEFRSSAIYADVRVKSYTPADANGDGQITIVDVVAVVNALMGNAASNFIFDAADMNQDGQITIVDVVAVVNTLMGGSAQVNGARSILHSNLHVADAEVAAGETTTLYVKLDNAQAYTAMQMDVELPEGLSIEGVEMVGNASHAVTYNAEGRIASYSLTNRTFNGGESLMAITIKADESFTGTANVDFTNVRVVSKDVVETALSDTFSTVTGGAYGIDAVEADKAQVLYYSTTGEVSDKPFQGLNIIKRIYQDGRIEVTKEMNP